MNKFLAFLIHILTASGGIFALLALIAAADRQWMDMFFWLFVAQVVDGVDGPLARRYKVVEILPNWSGDSLDFVIDYATYVFIPAFALTRADLLPQPLDLIAASVIVVTGGLYFADDRMKTESKAFRGFPAVWNGALFYLFLWAPGPVFGMGMVLFLAAAQFVPVEFIHPVRVKEFRPFTLLITAIWSAFALHVILNNMQATQLDQIVLTTTGLYFFAIGAFLHYRRSKVRE